MPTGAPPTVLVTTRFFDDAAERWLSDQRYDVRRSGLRGDQVDSDISEDRLRELLADAQGWIVGVARVSRELLAEHPRLRIIARRGVGYDSVDTTAAAEYGKFVTIAPGGNEASVADHALALMLGVAKRLREGHARMVAANWGALETAELYGKTVGLVGLGRIAKQVARRLTGFDVRIIAFDPFADTAAAEQLGIELVDIDSLLSRSDYVSLHAPLTERTRHMIDAAAIARMKAGAILVNTSRGELIDESDLLDALQRGHLGGAGLDVFEGESNSQARSVAAELLGLPNVIGSPHSAGSSREGLARTNMIAARCVRDVLKGRLPRRECMIVEGNLPRSDCGARNDLA